MEGEEPTGVEPLARWLVMPEDNGDRGRCPHRRLPDGGLRLVASVGVSQTPADSGDDEIAARVAAGDVAALEVLYDRHAGVIYSLALAMLGSAERAEEVLSDTFMRYWESAAVLPPGIPPGEALLTLAREQALALRRRRPESGPDDQAARLASVCAALPQDQRRVLELAYLDGLREREIAARLGISVKRVRRLLRLGFARLRRHLDLPTV